MFSFRRLSPLLLAPLMLAACGQAAAPTPSTAAPAAPASSAPTSKPAASSVAAKASQPAASAAGATKLTVSYSNVSPTFLPAWVAQEAGLYAKSGLKVNLQRIAGGAKTEAALLSDQTDIALAGGSEGLSARSGGAQITIVGVLIPISPWEFMVPASVKSGAELKGKKVGVVTIGGSADIETRVGLPKVGVDPNKDVTLVQTGSTSNLVAAMLGGAVAGGAVHPPDNLKLEANGFHVLFDLSKSKTPFSDGAITLKQAFVTSHHDAVQKFVDATIEGLAKVRNDKAFAVKVLAKYYKSDDQKAMEAAYDYYAKGIYPAYPYPKPDQFKDGVDALSIKNPKVKDVKLADLLDASFVKSAEERGVGKK